MNKLFTLRLLHYCPTIPPPPSPLSFPHVTALWYSHTTLTPEAKLITIARALIIRTVVFRNLTTPDARRDGGSNAEDVSVVFKIVTRGTQRFSLAGAFMMAEAGGGGKYIRSAGNFTPNAPPPAAAIASVALTYALNHACTYTRDYCIALRDKRTNMRVRTNIRVEIKDKYPRHAISPGNMTAALPEHFTTRWISSE